MELTVEALTAAGIPDLLNSILQSSDFSQLCKIHFTYMVDFGRCVDDDFPVDPTANDIKLVDFNGNLWISDFTKNHPGVSDGNGNGLVNCPIVVDAH